MVRLHVKCGDESHFLFDTTVTTPTDVLIPQILEIYHARLKVFRICSGKQKIILSLSTINYHMDISYLQQLKSWPLMGPLSLRILLDSRMSR